METSLIRALIASYFSIVRQTIQDLVPKAIMRQSFLLSFLLSLVHFTTFTPASMLTRKNTDLLVNFSRESVQNRLVASLYKDSLFADLLYEDEGLTAERTRVKALLQAYKEAFTVRPSSLSSRVSRTSGVGWSLMLLGLQTLSEVL